MLNRVANLLEIEGANPFRVRAYRNAARTVEDLPQELAILLKQGEDLSSLPGIGQDLAGKITAMVTTGHLPLLQQLEENIPSSLLELTKLSGLGPH